MVIYDIFKEILYYKNYLTVRNSRWVDIQQKNNIISFSETKEFAPVNFIEKAVFLLDQNKGS